MKPSFRARSIFFFKFPKEFELAKKEAKSHQKNLIDWKDY